VERAVALRLTRQEILRRDEGLPIDQEHKPRLWAIIDEAALNRFVGGTEVMRAQRDHLIEMANLAQVTIQIIPAGEGVTCAFGRFFTIIRPSANGTPVVYLEDVGSARYVRDRDEVARYVLTFDHLRSCAPSDRRSLQLIKELKIE
jgi:hypothetical protein